MKWWPDNPDDSKNLHLSLASGLAVAIIIIFNDLMTLFFPDGKKIFTLVLFLLLFLSYIKILNNYIKLRDGLDDIDIRSKKRKK